jgi:hypothetical protein
MEPTACEVKWSEVHASFERQHDSLLENHPDAEQEISIIRKALIKIRQLVKASPAVNGNGSIWKELADEAETERSVLCKHLDGKALIIGLMRLYAAIHREMVETVQADHSDKQEVDEHEWFKQQRRRKRSSSDEEQKQIKKAAKPTSETRDPRIPSQRELPTLNFFASLKTDDMELESAVDTSNQADEMVTGCSRPVAGEVGRLPLCLHLQLT